MRENTMRENAILRLGIAEDVRDSGINWDTKYVDGEWTEFTFYLMSTVGELGFFCYEVTQEQDPE